jgi:hypothetical protein
VRLTKTAALKEINSAKSLDTFRVSVDDANRNKTVQEIQKEIESKKRNAQDFVVIIIH